MQGEPLIADLGQDPSLRGLVSALEDVLIGVNQHKVELNATAPVFARRRQTTQNILAGKPASFSWRALVVGPRAAAAGAARLHRGAAGARLQVGRARP